jgi:7-cyano-7-deazaguanine reductase
MVGAGRTGFGAWVHAACAWVPRTPLTPAVVALLAVGRVGAARSLAGVTDAVTPAEPALDADLTLLGRPHNGPVEHVETFPAPAGCTKVVFSTDEVASLCPVTGQPDISSVRIAYVPDQRCIESKSLKLYLWSFRDRAAFCEAMAAEIADEVVRAADPHEVTVTLRQRPRGGIVIEATATRSKGS